MPQIVTYLLGGLTVFLATDVVSLPSPTELAGALRARLDGHLAAEEGEQIAGMILEDR